MTERLYAGANEADSAIAADIERALAVDPSPAFTARVRMRVAQQQPRAVLPGGWMFAAAAAAVIALGLASGLSRHPTTQTVSDRATQPSTEVRRIETAPNAQVASSSAHPSLALRVPRHNPTLSNNWKTSPAVLIDPRERIALERFIALAGARRVDPALAGAVAAAGDVTSDEIVIAPIAIDPIAPADGAEGERQ